MMTTTPKPYDTRLATRTPRFMPELLFNSVEVPWTTRHGETSWYLRHVTQPHTIFTLRYPDFPTLTVLAHPAKQQSPHCTVTVTLFQRVSTALKHHLLLPPSSLDSSFSLCIHVRLIPISNTSCHFHSQPPCACPPLSEVAAKHCQSSASMASREVSAMIKQGFISDPSFSLSPSKPANPKLSPCSPPSKTLLPLSPPPAFSSPSLPSPESPARPTLFEMMSEEQLREAKQSNETSRRRLQDKFARVLSKNPNLIDSNNSSSSNLRGLGFGVGLGPGDVKLTVSARDGFKVSLDVHRSVLAGKSMFFAEKLSKHGTIAQSVEICDCDDVEIYVETVVLMYSDDLKTKLVGEDVSKVLDLLKVSAALMFESGISSFLEYLEAVPWSEDEEERVVCCLSQLDLQNSMVDDVLQRVSSDQSSKKPDDLFLKTLTGVLQAKDDKSRREMKSLISRLLRDDGSSENTSSYGEKVDVSKDALYNLCHTCLSSLILCLSEATCIDETKQNQDRSVILGEIAREADNLQWIVEILIEKRVAAEFVELWAEQAELAKLHAKIPTMYRHEVSRVTAQLCVGIGRGRVLVARETRGKLLGTWVEALWEDFGWMRRSCRRMDKKVVEEGLSQTILTLPMKQQEGLLLRWFERYLNKGDDCPNLQRAFEGWWRRAFVRRYGGERERCEMQMTVCDYPT